MDFRYLTDVLTRDEALGLLERALPGRAARIEELMPRRLPGLHHHAGLAGLL